MNKELQETDRRLNDVRGEMRETEGVMTRMKKSIGGFGSMFLGGAALATAFQGVKRLVMMNAELSDAQANELKKKKEQLLLDLENMRITQKEKDELMLLLTEQHEMNIADIRQKYRDQELQANMELHQALIESEEKLYQAKQNFHRAALGSLMSFFSKSSGIYRALFILEKALAVNEIIVGASKAIATAQANHAMYLLLYRELQSSTRPGLFPSPI